MMINQGQTIQSRGHYWRPYLFFKAFEVPLVTLYSETIVETLFLQLIKPFNKQSLNDSYLFGQRLRNTFTIPFSVKMQRNLRPQRTDSASRFHRPSQLLFYLSGRSSPNHLAFKMCFNEDRGACRTLIGPFMGSELTVF